MRKKIISAFLVCAPLFLFAQSKDILFTINDEPINVDDFKRMYQKNLDIVDDNLRTSIDNYLDLYIDYTLKVKEAKAIGLDEEESFKREYNKYRTQLVNKYMTNIDVTEKLVKEAYDRMQKAVNASHILINVSPNAMPEDTLKTYNRIMEIRKEIKGGKNFEEMAKKYSEDPSAKKNGGNLGWFTVFDMVYPFETAAYETEVGKISMPVRTQFGYHLVKVNDKRPALGEITVAHIMISPKDSIDAEKRIREIYKQVKKGVAFDSLAREYSDDRNSAIYGGKLDAFAPGDLNSQKFEDIAFSMEKSGSISEPFKTKFGWHIVKLIEKHPIGSFEEELSGIEEQVRKDSRARIISGKLMDKLGQRYNFKRNTDALGYFYETVDDGILNGSWYIKHIDFPEKNIIEIGNEAKTYADFAGYMVKMQKIPIPEASGEKSKENLINKFYKDFTDKFLLDYHRAHLEEVNPEFAAVAREYYNGLLLFDLMEEKVWNAARTDTLGLKEYFRENREKYKSDSLVKIRGKVVGDYQNQLEKKWMESLHDKYEIEINKKALRKIKREFDEE